MKTKFLFAVIFFLSSGFVFGSDKEQFDKAEKLYNTKKYDEALAVYSSLLEENEISPVIFFNIGNCYFKKGDYINALLYYEKSEKYAPGKEDVLMNMEITRAKLTDKSDEFTEGVSGWFYSVINSRVADHWTYMAIFSSLLGSALLLLILFSSLHSLKRMMLATSLVAFLFAIVFVIFSYYQISYFNADDIALIGEQNAEVKSEPEESSKTVFIIPGGIKIKILSEKDNWSEIMLNANVGWVKTEILKKI